MFHGCYCTGRDTLPALWCKYNTRGKRGVQIDRCAQFIATRRVVHIERTFVIFWACSVCALTTSRQVSINVRRLPFRQVRSLSCWVNSTTSSCVRSAMYDMMQWPCRYHIRCNAFEGMHLGDFLEHRGQTPPWIRRAIYTMKKNNLNY